MEQPETSFQLPIGDLLFKIDPDAAAKSHLMPIHWKLYSDLLERANTEKIFLGSSISKQSEEVFNTLLKRKIIVQNPISYDEWSATIATKKEFQPVKQTETNSSDFITQLEADISSVETTPSNSIEVDLDFLDN